MMRSCPLQSHPDKSRNYCKYGPKSNVLLKKHSLTGVKVDHETLIYGANTWSMILSSS